MFRLTMGSSQSRSGGRSGGGGGGGSTLSASANGNPAVENAPPLRFHPVCGENIVLEEEGFRARRVESFCKGVLFSDRPVHIGERVCLRILDLSSRWSGVLRLGFSAHNPAIVGSGGGLPKYACPDLTSRPGYWAKALAERFTEPNVLVQYHVTANGDVHFAINGQDKGIFFSGVDTRQPLWALVDLYGNCTGLELIDVRIHMNNFHRSQREQQLQHQQQLQLQQQLQQQQMLQQRLQHHHHHQQTVIPMSGDPGVQLINSRMAGMTLQRNSQQQQRMLVAQHRQEFAEQQQLQVSLPQQEHRQQPEQIRQPEQQQQPEQPQPPALPSTQNFLPLRHNRHAAFRPLNFHFCAGRHVSLSENSMVAVRHEEEFALGYAFTAAPLRLGERIVVQILGIEDAYIGSLAFGVTNADPSTFDTRDLPEDSDMLLDRPEYWVVSKDVARSPAVGDELSFLARPDGSVEFSKNGQPPAVFMHVDASLRLWAFFDVYGNTSKIRILGSTADPLTTEQMPPPAPIQQGGQLPPPPPPLPLVSLDTENPAAPGSAVSSSGSGGVGGAGTECTVCCEKPVDCAIYTCGHMCMCYGCAMQQWKGRGGGFCPICREDIRDVIRTYRA